ncbi:hypothetical protein GCM10027048_13190 [Hymenobacter coalescens]
MAALLVLAGCGKDSSKPSSTQVSGRVTILDEFGREATDKSGVQVAVEGNGATAVTKADGSFSLTAPTGMRTLVFSKQYVGTYRLIDQALAGNATPLPLVRLGTSSTAPPIITMVVRGAPGLLVYGSSSLPNAPGYPPRRHRLFFSSQTPLTPTEYGYSFSGKTNVGSDQFVDTVSYQQLQAAGLRPGATLYVRAYGDNAYADAYRDPGLNRLIYPAVGANGSSIAQFPY